MFRKQNQTAFVFNRDLCCHFRSISNFTQERDIS